MYDKSALEEVATSLQSPRYTAFKIAFIYACISAVWILFSDQLLSMFVKDIEIITRIQMVKGWVFVLATSFLIFLLLQNDIKKYRQVEEALRHSKKQLLSLMDAMPVALSWTDEQGNIQYSNRKFRKLFGYTLADMPTVEQWFQLAYPDEEYRHTVASDWQAVVENAQNSEPEIAPIQVTITCKDGSTRYVDIIGTLLHDRILAVFNDLTERKKMDKQLQLMQRWVEQSDDLFFWVGGDSRILYVNRAVCHSLGYTKDEFRTMKVGDFDLEVTREAWPDFTQKLREQGSYRFETRMRKKNGQVFPVEISANILKFERKDHFFAYGRDISEKISAEEKRKKLENQLRQAQKMEAIGTLAGGIAHDFNNILSSVLGFAELVKYDIPENELELKDNIEEVINAGLRAKDLVQHILTFSRHSEVNKRPLRIGPLIKETIKFLRASLPASIEIQTKINEYKTAIYGDTAQIHRVIMNLCTNAAHALRAEGGVLEIHLEKTVLSENEIVVYDDLKPGDYLELRVSDSGHGIPAEKIDRIFDPFFTTKERGEGTGLGLSVVHGIVKEMQGTIHVESTPGKGATFQVLLPIYKGSVKLDAIHREKELPKGKGRILFVDDEESICLATSMVLQKLGYAVSTMTESLKALKLFVSDPDAFDLIITDLGMPKMDGIELSRQILDKRPGVPILLCTGFSGGVTQETLRDTGIHAMVMKPLIATELADVVKSAISLNK
jgi:PAS domain S-box-containing protein